MAACRCSLLKDLDALKALLPHAAAEPVYWSKPFELELFTQLEASLRRVAEHIGMLSWLMRFASKVLDLKAWRPLHDCWHAQAGRSIYMAKAFYFINSGESKLDGDQPLVLML